MVVTLVSVALTDAINQWRQSQGQTGKRSPMTTHTYWGFHIFVSWQRYEVQSKLHVKESQRTYRSSDRKRRHHGIFRFIQIPCTNNVFFFFFFWLVLIEGLLILYSDFYFLFYFFLKRFRKPKKQLENAYNRGEWISSAECCKPIKWSEIDLEKKKKKRNQLLYILCLQSKFSLISISASTDWNVDRWVMWSVLTKSFITESNLNSLMHACGFYLYTTVS